MNLATNAHHAMEESGGVLSVFFKESELGESDFKNLNLKPACYGCLTVKDTRIILCTGFSEKMTPEVAMKIGINEILFKPVAMNELGQKIRKVLDK